MHLFAPESSIDGNRGSTSVEHSSLRNYEPHNRGGAFQDPGSDSPELLVSSLGMVGGWSRTMNSNVMHFATSMAATIPILGCPLSQTREAGLKMQEIAGRVGGNNGLNNCVPPLGASHAASPAERLGPIQMTRGNSWSALDVLNTVAFPFSPSSGVQVLQGAELATSHCLARFSSNPGFAERAPKSLNMGNGNYYSQTAYSQGSDGVKSGGRSIGGDNDGKISRSFSSNSRLPNLVPSKITDVRNSRSSADSKVSGEIESRPVNDQAPMEQEGREIEKYPAMHDDNKSQTRIEDKSTSMEAFEGGTETGGPMHDTDEPDGPEHSSCSDQAHGDWTQARGKTVYIGMRKLLQADDEDCKDPAANSVARSAGRDNGQPAAAAAVDGDETKLLKRKRSGEITKEDAKFQTDRTFSESYSGESSPLLIKESTKLPELPKQDYIHVRARRGEATDSHSLAERVRREKISERMKYLQELVPGCSKVTGKAVMLDEIINYVQSLQLQVEFLSMKLAAVNARLDFDVDKFLAEEVQSSRASTAPPILLIGPDPTAMSYGYQRPFQQRHVHNLQSVGSSDLDDLRPLDSAFEASLQRTMTAAVSTPLSCFDAFAGNFSQVNETSQKPSCT